MSTIQLHTERKHFALLEDIDDEEEGLVQACSSDLVSLHTRIDTLTKNLNLQTASLQKINQQVEEIRIAKGELPATVPSQLQYSLKRIQAIHGRFLIVSTDFEKAMKEGQFKGQNTQGLSEKLASFKRNHETISNPKTYPFLGIQEKQIKDSSSCSIL